MEKVQWKVEGMDCNTCAINIHKYLEKQGMKNVKNLQCLGSQTYQGAQYNTFSFDSSGETMGIKSSSHIMMYTDGNNRPAWMEIDGKAMGKASKTIQHITFDPSITINPPK